MTAVDGFLSDSSETVLGLDPESIYILLFSSHSLIYTSAAVGETLRDSINPPISSDRNTSSRRDYRVYKTGQRLVLCSFSAAEIYKTGNAERFMLIFARFRFLWTELGLTHDYDKFKPLSRLGLN